MTKKRKIERIKAKNRFFTCEYGVYDLSKIEGILLYGTEDAEILDFIGKHGCYIHRIDLIKHKDSVLKLIEIMYKASEQLKQLKSYENTN